MKTVRRFLVTLLLSLAIVSMPVYAEERETDPYTGELITWDRTVAGEEEGAGLPENMGTGEASENRIEDEVEVLKEMYRIESAVKTDGRALTTCRFLIPDYGSFDWNQNNVKVILRGGSGVETILLYRQAGFETNVQLKTGRYAFVSARTIDGGTLFKTKEPWLEIRESGENIFPLVPAEGNLTAADIVVSEELETVPEEEEKQKEHRAAGGILILLAVTGIAVILIGIAAAIVVVIRKRKERYS